MVENVAMVWNGEIGCNQILQCAHDFVWLHVTLGVAIHADDQHAGMMPL